ncbi:unnamed protein product [Paramecium sonneborni]|uniref:Uncharacterized protein n=1 Tax=Paramecium sonneborni TaxID=65129 RepID=A0A8S1RS97_9CILI|nr:unnamed protein product [Paramecium sonneborni]
MENKLVQQLYPNTQFNQIFKSKHKYKMSQPNKYNNNLKNMKFKVQYLKNQLIQKSVKFNTEIKIKKKLEIIQTDHLAPKKQLIVYLLQSININIILQEMFQICFYEMLLNMLQIVQGNLKINQKNFIDQLIKLYQHWIKLIDNQSATILRMNKEIDLPSIIR